MAEAGDREQLGNALDQADDRGLQVGQVCHARPFAMSWEAAGIRPDALRPGEARVAYSDRRCSTGTVEHLQDL